MVVGLVAMFTIKFKVRPNLETFLKQVRLLPGNDFPVTRFNHAATHYQDSFIIVGGVGDSFQYQEDVYL